MVLFWFLVFVDNFKVILLIFVYGVIVGFVWFLIMFFKIVINWFLLILKNFNICEYNFVLLFDKIGIICFIIIGFNLLGGFGKIIYWIFLDVMILLIVRLVRFCRGIEFLINWVCCLLFGVLVNWGWFVKKWFNFWLVNKFIVNDLFKNLVKVCFVKLFFVGLSLLYRIINWLCWLVIFKSDNKCFLLFFIVVWK